MLEQHSLFVLAPVCSVTEKKKKNQVFLISHVSKKQYH